MYDASTNTLYRYTPPPQEAAARRPTRQRPARTKSRRVAKIEEAIAHLREHANVSGATPTDVAGQPAYTVRVSPKEGGSLIGGAELSWDAVTRRAAARRDLLLDQLRAGDRTGGQRNLLRPGRRLGVRLHAAGRARRSKKSTLPDEHDAGGSADAAGDTTSRRSPTHGHGITARSRVLEGKAKRGREGTPSAARRAAEGQDQRRRAPPSCRPRSARCSASSAPACATCSPARSRRPPSRQSRGASSVSDAGAPTRRRRSGRGAWSSATRRSSRSTTST